jgi:putative transposase
VLHHDNGTQFTSAAYRDAAGALKITLSRTAYRHSDGNAFIERLYLTLKTECCWINEFADYAEALAAIQAWVLDYNNDRPHQSLADATPAEARAAARTPTKTAA